MARMESDRVFIADLGKGCLEQASSLYRHSPSRQTYYNLRMGNIPYPIDLETERAALVSTMSEIIDDAVWFAMAVGMIALGCLAACGRLA